MVILRNILIVMLIVCEAHSLVHYQKFPGDPEAKTCTGPDGDIQINDYVQHKDFCGIIYCMTGDGDTLIHYCQLPATFAKCDETGVKTNDDFPDCCWRCVKYKKC